MIDVDTALTFLKVAETNSFQLAARHLNVTQSTVSARIRVLEERLGLKVFERSRSGASLNAHGRAFVRHAAAMVHAWEEGKRAASLPAEPEDSNGVGGEHNLWTRLLAIWLLELRAALPAVHVSAEAADADRLLDGLSQSRLDVVVMHTAPDRPDLIVERLMDDELVLVTTDPDGGYADRYVDIVWPMDEHASAQREALVARARTSIALGFSSVNYLIISQAAGYLPRRLVEPYLSAKRLYLAPEAPVFHSAVYVVRRAGQASPGIDTSLTILRDLAALAERGELPPPFWSQVG
jgi:LysR family transcriptional regulator, flagellar master operon regulator